MLPGDPAVRLYACDDPAHPTCKQPAGKRCVNAKGKGCPPHPKRWNLGQGYSDAWNQRQSEVDGANAQLSAVTSQLADANASASRFALEADGLRTQLAAANEGIASRDARITGLNDANAALEKQIHDLTHPEPPPPSLRVGAAVGGNSSPATIEKAVGKALPLRRTFWGGGDVDKAVGVCSADIAAGRLPFITFKLPHNWGAMASGLGDAWARDLGGKLALLGGEVWIDFHHEPEGDSNGTPAEWTAMQQHLIPLVASARVKVGVCYTGWQEVNNDATWTFEKTWPSKAQFLAVDIYQRYGTPKSGKKWSPIEAYFTKVQTFAEKVGVPWGLGETGVTDEAMTDKPSALADLFASVRAHNGAFVSYFSSSLNSVGTWPLTGAKLTAFAKECQ